jgi:hypothetical protein
LPHSEVPPAKIRRAILGKFRLPGSSRLRGTCAASLSQRSPCHYGTAEVSACKRRDLSTLSPADFHCIPTFFHLTSKQGKLCSHEQSFFVFQISIVLKRFPCLPASRPAKETAQPDDHPVNNGSPGIELDISVSADNKGTCRTPTPWGEGGPGLFIADRGTRRKSRG